MLRKLLACLALLTGLTAAGVSAPASAAVILSATVASNVASDAASKNCSGASETAQPRSTKPAKSAVPARTATIMFRVPSVYLGCDRTRE